jgi:hypothetical protein
LAIIKTGFAPYTHFAKNLQDSLEFGGSWVFTVWFKNASDNWQFMNKRRISPLKIHRLTQYRPIVRIGTQPHLTRKLDGKWESRNLKGRPLSI